MRTWALFLLIVFVLWLLVHVRRTIPDSDSIQFFLAMCAFLALLGLV